MKFSTTVAAIVVAVFAQTVTAVPVPQSDFTPTSGSTVVTFGEESEPSQGGKFANF
ncbi:hypothetical protein PILCRDRAFT_816297 [Piloderma croceum F 1598]|uniref:Uncharacterized protein n=1 Tax=Piloderma croceum (strain F 1598) TaxID=765440 RepID=A0A0C3G6Q7_PILCF|nr:hypothetical protein PILCRDRAFT_816297 [Piloderma croceum F 1598]